MSGFIKALLISLFLAPAAAMAADLPMEPAAPVVSVPSFSWTGAYVGLQGAYHDGKTKDSTCTGTCIGSHKIKEFYLAAVAGYDYQFENNVVVGAFGGIGLTPVKDHARLPGTPFDIKGKTTFGAFGGVRVGYAFDRFLPYAFGGYQYLRGKVTNEATASTIRKSHDGFSVGGGVEYAVTNNISVDGKVYYTRYGKKTYNYGGGPSRVSENSVTFALGINYRFGTW